MEKTKVKRKLTGLITSDKMTNTVIVKVEVVKVHPKYHKRYRIFKKFAAHNPNNEFKAGERVVIQESKPLSKTKNWVVIGKAN